MSISGGGNQYGSGYGPPRRFNPRLIIGLVIALIGVVSYFTKTQINPVTGEKQRVAMSADQEMALGLQAAPQMAQEMGGVIDPKSDPRAATVQRIGWTLVNNSPDVQKSPYTHNFNFYLLRDPQTINAFALPGGQIFITAGLYDRLEDEAELAGVLGHEIGHVINRHAAEHMATGQLGQMLVTGVAVGTSDRDNGRVATMAAAMANQMLQLKYSRGDELEADLFGMSFMSQSGFDPTEQRRVMEILKQAAGSGRPGSDIFATHPNPDARIEKIEQFLKEKFPNGIPKTLTKGVPLRGGGAPLELER
jgi:predicted Zn-dependent protease